MMQGDGSSDAKQALSPVEKSLDTLTVVSILFLFPPRQDFRQERSSEGHQGELPVQKESD